MGRKAMIELRGSFLPGEQACERCPFEGWCVEHVWTGAVLPCQPMDELPVAVLREAGDFVQLWAPANETNANLRPHNAKRGGALVETPTGGE